MTDHISDTRTGRDIHPALAPATALNAAAIALLLATDGPTWALAVAIAGALAGALAILGIKRGINVP